MKALFLYNRNSGGSYSKTHLKTLIEENNIRIDKWIPVNNDIASRLSKDTTKDCLVYVCGGDGTMNSVANSLAGTDSIMIPLPGGTLNHFIRDVGVGLELKEVVYKLSLASIDKRIDIGSVNGHYFLNNSSIGLYAHSLKERRYLEKRILKWPAAILATIHTLIRFKRYTLLINNSRIRTPMVYVGNSKYSFEAGSFGLRKNLTSNTLTVAAIKSVNLFASLRLGLDVVLRTTKQYDSFDVDFKRTITLKTKRKKIRVAIDGENKLMNTPLHYQVHPKHLVVRIPK